MSFVEILAELQAIQKLDYDSTKEMPKQAGKPVRNEAAFREKQEKALIAKEEKKATLKEKVREEKGELGSRLLESILEKKYPATKNPQEANQYGNFFNPAVYQELLVYTKLAYEYEKNGIAEEHALKLAVLFGDAQSALNYVKKMGSVHDACLFGLPPIDKCDFGVWQKHAKKYVENPQFRKLLVNAGEIEDQIKNNVQEQKPDFAKIRLKKDEINKKNAEWKVLKKSHERRQADPERYQRLGQELLRLNEELLSFSAGVPLSQIDLMQLVAYNDQYINSSSDAYKYFLEHGLTKRDFIKFSTLDREEAGKNMPDVFLDGNEIGYPGYYFKKVDVQDEREAARAACFGKETNCCQSLSGEVGEPCTIHGLTSPNGGFYVLCKGDAAHPTTDDELIAQSWAWRSKSNGLVFDSVETAKTYKGAIGMIVNVFHYISDRLVINPIYGITQVTCGAGSGISAAVGFKVKTDLQTPIDYEGYRDSHEQLMLARQDRFYLLLGETYLYSFQAELKERFRDLIKKNVSVAVPLRKSPVFMQIFHDAGSTENRTIFELIQQTLPDREAEIDVIGEACRTFSQKIDTKFDLTETDVDNLVEAGADVDVLNEQGKTALVVAAETGNITLLKKLLQYGADVNATCSTENNYSALFFAARAGHLEVVQELVARGANVNYLCMLVPALAKAAEHGYKEIVSFLLEQGTKFSVDDPGSRYIMWRVKRDGHKEIEEMLLKKDAENKSVGYELLEAVKNGNRGKAEDLILNGANANFENFSAETPLMLAVKSHDREMVSLLLKLGADINLDTVLVVTLMEAAITLMEAAINPLEAALETRDREMILHLLANGAAKNAIYNVELKLSSAVSAGDSEMVSLLLLCGVNVNEPGPEGKSPLEVAIEQADSAMVELLLKNNADVNVENGKPVKENGRPLEVATQRKDATLLSILLDHGAKANSTLRGKALMVAAETRNLTLFKKLLQDGDDVSAAVALHEAAVNGHTEIVSFLLEQGIKFSVDDPRSRFLMVQVKNKRQKEIEEILLKKDAESKNIGYELLEAVKNGNRDKAADLISNGANVNFQNFSEETPLILAIKSHDREMVSLLLKRGADINFYVSGITSLRAALETRDREMILHLLANGAKIQKELWEEYKLSAAIRVGDSEMVSLLRLCGVNVKEPSLGMPEHKQGEQRPSSKPKTLLFYKKSGIGTENKAIIEAIEKENTSDLGNIMRENANKVIDPDLGSTSLMLAAQAGSIQSVLKLLELGADVQFEDKDGENALFWALECDDVLKCEEIVKILVDRGVNLTHHNHKNETALGIARQKGLRDDLLKLLDPSTLSPITSHFSK